MVVFEFVTGPPSGAAILAAYIMAHFLPSPVIDQVARVVCACIQAEAELDSTTNIS